MSQQKSDFNSLILKAMGGSDPGSGGGGDGNNGGKSGGGEDVAKQMNASGWWDGYTTHELHRLLCVFGLGHIRIFYPF